MPRLGFSPAESLVDLALDEVSRRLAVPQVSKSSPGTMKWLAVRRLVDLSLSMAYFDPVSRQLVLHIVYDGSPFAGKTASIESLGRLLQRAVVSPQVESGRTQLFDWLEYEGGTKFGRPIVCRVITVPGQPELASRRHWILRRADGIVFVADSRAEFLERSLRHWRDLGELIDAWGLRAPVSVQLNHRDADSALPLGDLQARFDDRKPRYIAATQAVHDQGIRETFVKTVGDAVRVHVPNEGRSQLESPFDGDDTLPVQASSSEELEQMLNG